MKKNNHSIWTLALALLISSIVAIPAFLQASAPELNTAAAPESQSSQDQPMRSREIIEKGTFVEITGSLRHMGGEWFLAADQVPDTQPVSVCKWTRKIDSGSPPNNVVRATGPPMDLR